VVTPPPLIAAPDTPPPRAGAGGAASSAVAPVLASPSFSPLYQQIKILILRSLQNGEWRPGEAIPSEIDLAARFKVSQGTVRKAVDELAAENLLVRRLASCISRGSRWCWTTSGCPHTYSKASPLSA